MSVPIGVMDPDDRGVRPAYVRFSRQSIEDRNATLQAGHVVEIHKDIVHINPPGSRDCVERDVKGWLENLKSQVRDRMIPQNLLEYYRMSYERWCQGQEMPPAGTPILGWQLLSATEQQRVIGANILTVEDLADASHEHIQMIGIGAMAMNTKARNWIAVGSEKGAVALKVQALEEKNAELTRQVEALLQTANSVTTHKGKVGWPKGRPRGPRAVKEERLQGADNVA